MVSDAAASHLSCSPLVFLALLLFHSFSNRVKCTIEFRFEQERRKENEEKLAIKGKLQTPTCQMISNCAMSCTRLLDTAVDSCGGSASAMTKGASGHPCYSYYTTFLLPLQIVYISSVLRMRMSISLRLLSYLNALLIPFSPSLSVR